ncbi:MAG: endoglucanase [Ignavibacteriae bacterium]|nr:endoglucanase [Ignavibacteriota bacterium]MCB9215493.1 endoglucanase [Ignavibacteria bacterium]
MKRSILTLILACFPAVLSSQNIDVDISVDTEIGFPISPLIYGVNNSDNPAANLASRRLGGDRFTTYNWENNASNSGHWTDDPNQDHISDAFLTNYVPSAKPAKAITDFHDQSVARGTYSVVTLPLGYVARDIKGVVAPAQAVPNLNRWREVLLNKGAPFSTTPDTSDAGVYTDELLAFLIGKYGDASTETGIKGYGIGNEPGLWYEIHPRCHPVKEGYADIFEMSVNLASLIKSVDPAAEVYGGVTYGFAEMKDFQGAPDAGDYANYKWYINAYLNAMKLGSDLAGVRLVDVLDVHWYSEAEGNAPYSAVAWSGNEPDIVKARLQAPRSLWDPTFVEKSWITGAPEQVGGADRYSHTMEVFGERAIALIPRLQESIQTYNPEVNLAFGEFGYGGYDHISGGLAVADVLGIFGKYNVYYANHWDDINGYVESAYKLYRNYDGENSTFGDQSVYSETSDIENNSVYTSLDGDGNLHIILLNKSVEKSIDAQIAIASNSQWESFAGWRFKGGSTQIESAGSGEIAENQMSVTLPPLSASHFVLQKKTSSVPTAATADLSFEVFPNPVSGEATISAEVPAGESATLQLLDPLGRVLRTYTFDDLSSKRLRFSLDGDALPSGEYGLVLSCKGMRLLRNVVVVH